MHGLRHSAAMRLLRAGIVTSMIALWLGHEQVERIRTARTRTCQSRNGLSKGPPHHRETRPLPAHSSPSSKLSGYAPLRSPPLRKQRLTDLHRHDPGISIMGGQTEILGGAILGGDQQQRRQGGSRAEPGGRCGRGKPWGSVWSSRVMPRASREGSLLWWPFLKRSMFLAAASEVLPCACSPATHRQPGLFDKGQPSIRCRRKKSAPTRPAGPA